jgi:predicted methyltransferase
MNIRTLGALVVLAATAGIARAAPPAAVPVHVAAAVADPSRPADDREVDPQRKPAQVLAFAGVRPGETVAEYLPGGGYYTRMLSDIVGPKGKVYALETTTWGQENIDATKKALAEPGRQNVAFSLSPLGAFHLPAKVDLFWISDNYHDLHVPKYASVDMLAFNKLVFDSLKPGGIYFIFDHAATPGTGVTLTPKLHRIDKATVIAEVTAAGFQLAGESDVLADPTDDHSKNVFQPSMHYKTDQFVLKFRKP